MPLRFCQSISEGSDVKTPRKRLWFPEAADLLEAQ